MGLYSGGLIIERIFAFEIWGAYFREGLLLLLFFLVGGGGRRGGGGGLNIGILRYNGFCLSLQLFQGTVSCLHLFIT